MSIRVTDDVGALSASAKQALEGLSSPLQIKVVFQSAPSREVLSNDMWKCVISPDIVCVGVDPKHKFTATQFGKATGISQSDFPTVARAGNADFHDGNWTAGVKAIVNQANTLARQSHEYSSPIYKTPLSHQIEIVGAAQNPIHQTLIISETPVPVWPFILGFGIIAVVVWLSVRYLRKSQDRFTRAIENKEREAAELASRNIKESAWMDALEKKADTASLPSSQSNRPPTPVSTPLLEQQRQPDDYDRAFRRQAPTQRQPEPVYRTQRQPEPVVRTVYQPVVQPPVVVVDSGPSFVDGLIVGEMLTRPSPTRSYYDDDEPRHRRHRTPTPTPEPVQASSNDSSFFGSTSNDDDSSSGGDSSSFSDDSSSDSSDSSSGGDDSSF